MIALAALGVAVAVEMEIEMDTVSPRSWAPVPVTVTLKGSAPLTEGTLRIKMMQRRSTLVNYRTEPLVVTSAARELRLLLPPLAHPERGNTLAEWDLAFETENEVFRRKGLSVTIPTLAQTIATVALVHPQSLDVPDAALNLLSHGRLEQVMGLNERGLGGLANRRVLTWTARLRPGELSTQPLGYGGYDMVVLSPSSLASLSGLQLDAMRDWIRAGGSALVLSQDEPPLPRDSPVVSFLEEVAVRGKSSPVAVDPQLASMGVALEGWKWDFGRVVHLRGLNLEEALEEMEWAGLWNFLWKTRYLEDPESQAINIPYIISSDTMRETRESVFEELMPETVRLLPVFQLAIMMGVFLLVVGPLEYRCLRRLGRRWLTWLTFPVTIILLTVASYVVAEKRLDSEGGKQIVLIDLGVSGEAVRSQEVTLTYPKSSGEVVETHRSVLAGPVCKEFRGAPEQHEDLFYEGRYPTAYTTTRVVRQWDPIMERRVSIPGSVAGPSVLREIDWEAFRPPPSSHQGDLAGRLANRLRGIEGLDGVTFLSEDGLLPQARWGQASALIFKWMSPHAQTLPSIPFRGVLQDPSRPSIVTMNFQSWVPFPRPGAPRCDRYLTDWIILDHDQWLITWKQGQDRFIARYLYHNND